MRLSYGFVRGNRLTCLYHGWGYDGQGSCVSIPAHPSLTPPKTIKVNRYEAGEAAGLIWVATAGSNDPLQDPGGSWISVQSIDMPQSLEAVRSAIAAAGTAIDADFDSKTPPAQEGHGSSSTDGAGSDSPLHRFQDGRLGRSVLCALQAVGDDSTTLHILVSAEGSGDEGVARRAYAKWGRRLRRSQGTTVRTPLALVAASAAERHARPLA